MAVYLTFDDTDPDAPGGADNPYRVTARTPRDAVARHLGALRADCGDDLGGLSVGSTLVVTVVEADPPGGGLPGRWWFELTGRLEWVVRELPDKPAGEGEPCR